MPKPVSAGGSGGRAIQAGAPHSFHLAMAVRALRQGRVIAYATEAVWGLGCAPHDESALRRLLTLKNRSWRKGMIVIAARFEQVQPLLRPLPVQAQARIEVSWPGPHTWLCPVRPEVTRFLRGRHATLAVRISAHTGVQALCERFGPLVSTSANRAGRPPARSSLAVRRALQGARSVHIVPGCIGTLKRPTPIRDALTGAVVRRG